MSPVKVNLVYANSLKSNYLRFDCGLKVSLGWYECLCSNSCVCRFKEDFAIESVIMVKLIILNIVTSKKSMLSSEIVH